MAENLNDFEISTIKICVRSLEASDNIMCMCLGAVLVMLSYVVSGFFFISNQLIHLKTSILGSIVCQK